MVRFIASVLLVLPGWTIAQQGPLKIGDRLPEFNIGHFLNWPESTLSSAHFKGKMLLFDFGATTCSPCVAAIPLLDSMQKQFAGKMQVLMVTRESSEKVQRFLQTNKIAKGASFPVITNDSVLSSWFPYGEIPHEVWVNADGVIVGITDEHYITTPHIELVLRGEKPGWPVKGDALSTIKDKTIKPFLPLESTQYYTLFSKRFQGYKAGGFFTTDTTLGKFYMRQINTTMRNLYNSAFDAGNLSYNTSTTKVDSVLLDAYSYNGTGFQAEWDEHNRYCFEMLAPLPGKPEELTWKIIRELDDYFGIRTSISKQPWKCIVLKKIEGSYPSKHKGDTCRTSLKSIILFLEQKGTKVVINEAGIPGDKLASIFIKIKYQQLADRNLLQQQLQQSGFCIIEEERSLEIVELKPAPKNR